MAHTPRSQQDMPGPPLSGPGWSTWGWVLFSLLVAVLLIYGFVFARGPALHAP